MLPNMLLARGAGRMRKISIRVAIGAGRARIVRQLLIESVLLAVTGGFLGWPMARGFLGWFDAATRPLTKPAWLNLSLDPTAFAYLAAISVTTGILFGLAPALRLAKVDVNSAIKDGGQGVAGARRGVSVSNLLVVAEMALCIVLLTGAGLMIRSTVNLYGAPIGANTTNVLTARVNLPEAKYPLPADQINFHGELKSRIGALAGVEASGIVSNVPLGGWTTFSYELEGSAASEPDRAPRIGAIIASPGYFDVMRVKALRGRAFKDSDGITGVPVVLVNDNFARKFWPKENAVGKRIRLVKARAQPWLTVIGVLPNIRQNGRRPLDSDPLIYLPYRQEPQAEMFIVASTQVPAQTLAAAFRREVQKIDTNLALYDIGTLEGHLAKVRLETSVVGGMFSVFGCLALVLAAIGLYAVISHGGESANAGDRDSNGFGRDAAGYPSAGLCGGHAPASDWDGARAAGGVRHGTRFKNDPGWSFAGRSTDSVGGCAGACGRGHCGVRRSRAASGTGRRDCGVAI